MRALLYLRWYLLRNAVRSTLSSPKRLISTVLFVGLVVLTLLVSLALSLAMRGSFALEIGPAGAQTQAGVWAVLVLLTVFAIQSGLEGAVLSFPPADYDFLFATPVPRRLVVAWRLVADAGITLVTVGLAVVSLLALAPSAHLLPDLSLGALLSLWIGGSLYALFVVNAARIMELILAGCDALVLRWRGWLKLALWVPGLICVGALVHAIWWGSDAAETLLKVVSRPPLSVVLIPLASVAALLTGAPPPVLGSTLATLGLLALLAVATAVAVCLLDRDLIEATIEHSARVSRMRAAAQAQNLEALTSAGLRSDASAVRSILVGWRTPELAPLFRFLATSSRRGGTRRAALAALLFSPALVSRLAPVSDELLRSSVAPLMMYALLMLQGTQSLMHMRGELSHLALLRSLPLPGWRQLLGFTVPHALLQALLLALALLALYLGRPVRDVGPYVAVALCLPMGCLVLSLVTAATTCVFPNPTDGVQRFVGGIVLMVCDAIALGPCILVFLTGALLRWSGMMVGLLGALALLPTAVLTTLVAAYLLERLEPGEE